MAPPRRPYRSTPRPARATRTCSSPSPRTAPSSTSTSSSAWSVVELASRPGRRQGDQPAGRRGPDRGRHRAGPGPGADGGDPDRDGMVRNPSFTDYLHPDDPRHAADADRRARATPTRTRRTGCAGVGEPPTISTPPAVAAALRAATGRALPRVPVRPEDLVGPTRRRTFVARYGAIFEGSPSGRARGVRRGAFAGVDDLHAAFEAAMRDAPRERQLEIVQAHPELAGREAQAGELTDASASEQAGAGLHRLTADEAEAGARSTPPTASASASRSSSACASTRKASILAWGAERLAHDPSEELEHRARRVAKIARLRLEELERDHHARPRHRARAGPRSACRSSSNAGRRRLGAGRPERDRRRRAPARPWPRRLAGRRAPPADVRHRRLPPRSRRAAFYPQVVVDFTVATDEHHHVPLLLSPIRIQHLPWELTHDVVLGQSNYGKSDVRVVKVIRDEAVTSLRRRRRRHARRRLPRRPRRGRQQRA